jgi:hypothetical protein
VTASASLEHLCSRTNISILLAARMLAVIEESGAAQTEVLAAIGVVQCLLPTIGISPVSEENDVVE